ncbi:MAG: TolC family protein [Phycisphaerales bacterium]
MRELLMYLRSVAGTTSRRCAIALTGAGVMALQGCTTPLQRRSEDDLRKSLLDSVDRELREARRTPREMELTRTDRVKSLKLKPEILKQLEGASGIGSYPSAAEGSGPQGIALGPSLLGGEQRAVAVNLQRAVMTALENNLNVQFARVGPAIEEARRTAAEAAFDWTFFSTLQWTNQDQENVTQSNGVPNNIRTFDERQDVQGSIGLRQRTVTGGQFTVQQNLTYTDHTTRGVFFRPDPSTEASLLLQFDQPLLRNFGSDVALAEISLATNSERDRILQLRAELNRTLTDTETAYWNLVRAAGELQIQRKLLDRGVDVRNEIEIRLGVDANAAQFANAVAAVETRRAGVIQAETTLRESSDRLKELMNDPELTLGSETLLLPVDQPQDLPLTFNFGDLVLTAVRERPEIQRALLGIDDSSIRLRVAESGRLPQLDMRAQMRFNSLASSSETALSRQADAELVDYLIGAALEMPLGNRGAEAGVRLRSLERIQAVITYRDVIRRIVADIKTNLRQAATAFELIEQTHAARLAAAEQLRALEAREKTVQAKTPEFLDFKLRTQEDLSQRERQELAAMTEYNNAIARVYAAAGTTLQRNRVKFEVPSTLLEQSPGLGR